MARATVGDLTARERRILARVATGAGNKQIARDLGLSESTVKNALTIIYRVLGVQSRTAATVALWRWERGI